MSEQEFYKIDDTHYIHVGEGPNGPCNSSVGPASWAGFDGEEYHGLWYCLGCQHFYENKHLPLDDEPEGLAALRHMTPVDDDGEL